MSYIDEWGLVTNKTGRSGNAALFSSEYLAAGGKLELAGIIRCEVISGLFIQHPVHFRADQNSPDNLTGLGYIAWRLDPTIAARILKHLRENHFFYVTEIGVDGLRAWFGRFPALIAHLQWAAGEKPNFLMRLAWCVSVGFKLDKTVHDSWILSWLLTLVAGDRGWMERWATRRFWKKFPWPSMADCLAEYFGGDENHPTVILLRSKNK